MNSRFEKYAQDQFNGHEIPVDTDALWAGIEPHVKPKNGNKKVIWMFMLGLLIGLSGFGVFYFNQTGDELIAADNNRTKTGYVSENSMTIETPENNKNTESKSTTNTVTKAIATDSRKATNSSNTKITSSTKEAKSNSQTAKVIKINPEAKKLTITSTSAKPETTVSNATETIQEVKPSSNVIKDNQIDELITNSTTKSSTVQNLRSASVLSKLPSLFPVGISAERSNSYERPFIEMIKKQQAENMTLLAKQKKDELAKTKLAQKKKRRRGSFFRDLQFGVGVYGGVSQSTTSLEASGDDLTYELLRSNSEKQLETVHLGLSALILTEQKAYLRTGIEYTRIGSLFSRSATSVTTDSIPGIVEIQINNITGDTTFINGLIGVTRTSDYIKKSYNYFHLVDVPIILGYNFGSDPWSIGVEAGIYANIMVKNKGEIASIDDTFYDKEEDPDSWYKDNIGISPFVGFNVGYKMTDNIQIHFSPSFRFPSTFSTSNNPLAEKHGTLGVHAGVRYLFDN